ncbi:hypothetical protein [Rossellomorea sp. DA94]|uniref:hypothetical protein n=1 Tax=Rossellomorea sp. DA94 TaxID=3038653 RepID=UPI00244AFD63|nr:hypothetical protein [Rossellomorea sp. DA94]WGG47657.1 hypothetical protein P8596_10805 [Rossellomorea sp. DA94]
MFRGFLLLLFGICMFLSACAENDSNGKEVAIDSNVVEAVGVTDEVPGKEEETDLLNSDLIKYLEDQGYVIETFDSYLGVSASYHKRPEALRKLDKDNQQYSFICEDNQTCEFLVFEKDNVVLQFNPSWDIENIFQIKDENNQILTPQTVQPFIEFVNEYTKTENERAKNELAEQREKQEEWSKVKIGMTADEVRERWGEPSDINRTITKYGTDEQWVYANYTYLYFSDGILETIQD